VPEPPPDPGGLLFAGHVFCDLVFTGVEAPKPGAEVHADGFAITPGGVANRAVAAARSGAATTIVGRVGDDPLGAHVRAVLAAEPRLDSTLLSSVPGRQTPVSVSLTGPVDRSFVTYEEPLGPIDLPEGAGRFAAAHLALEQPFPAWVGRLRRGGTSIVGGVGWDDSGRWPPEVLDRLAEVDVFVPNDIEAMRYTRTDDPVTAAKLLAERVPLVVVTCGRDGAVAVDSATGTLTRTPAIPVEVVDPTGAGDVFVATLMAAARHPWTLSQRLRYAALHAALSVTGHGGALSAPRPGDLAEFLTRHRPDGDWDFLHAHLEHDASFAPREDRR
jgi:sugar/nucleoside kinase (ribokinase family)